MIIIPQTKFLEMYTKFIFDEGRICNFSKRETYLEFYSVYKYESRIDPAEYFPNEIFWYITDYFDVWFVKS